MFDTITYPLFTTTFSLYVENSFGCSDSDEITIAVDRTRYIYVPNIFSPNDDGINDVFMIYAKDNQLKQINSFRGYDRWGSKLWEFDDFQPNDPNYSWDGTFLGESVNASVFAWYAELEYLSGEVEVIYGDVTIIK